MYIIQRPFNGFSNRLTGFKVMTNLYAKFHWNRTCDLEKKCGKGSIFVLNWVEYELYLH